VPGPDRKESIYLCLTLEQSTKDFRGVKSNTNLIECMLRTLSGLRVFGTDLDNVFYRFWHFTLFTESVRMKTNA